MILSATLTSDLAPRFGLDGFYKQYFSVVRVNQLADRFPLSSEGDNMTMVMLKSTLPPLGTTIVAFILLYLPIKSLILGAE